MQCSPACSFIISFYVCGSITDPLVSRYSLQLSSVYKWTPHTSDFGHCWRFQTQFENICCVIQKNAVAKLCVTANVNALAVLRRFGSKELKRQQAQLFNFGAQIDTAGASIDAIDPTITCQELRFQAVSQTAVFRTKSPLRVLPLRLRNCDFCCFGQPKQSGLMLPRSLLVSQEGSMRVVDYLMTLQWPTWNPPTLTCRRIRTDSSIKKQNLPLLLFSDHLHSVTHLSSLCSHACLSRTNEHHLLPRCFTSYFVLLVLHTDRTMLFMDLLSDTLLSANSPSLYYSVYTVFT